MRISLIFAVSVFSGLTSCRKDDNAGRAGTYYCERSWYTWMMGSPGSSGTEPDTILVDYVGSQGRLNEGTFLFDMLPDNETYSWGGGSSGGGWLYFRQDSLYLYSYGGGLGGGSSSYYQCLKE